jgi:hypothetical protein
MFKKGQARNEAPQQRDPGSPGISLADLKARRVPVQWFESVAVIQELCRALLEPGVDAGKAALGPKDVFIEPGGTVRFALNAAGSGDAAVRQIGELLRLSLADSAFPVPLRLVITQSASTPPSYASIAELSSAIEYFERPDRPGLVRAVYERAQSHPVSDAVADAAPEPEKEKPVPQNKGQRRRVPKIAIAASALVLTAAVVWLAASQISGRPRGAAPGANAQDGKTAGALGGFADKVSALADRVNPFSAGSAAVDTSASGPAPAEPKSDDKSPRTGSRKTGDTAARSRPRAQQPGAPVKGQQAAALSPGSVPTTFETVAISVEASPIDGSTDDSAADATVYSVSDRDVTPPVATYPRVPAEPPAGVGAENLSTLEVVVGETGHVESVRLRGQPAHLGEALLATMNLSAAKTWRFAPAVKDGRPVKYRKLVHVWLTAP